MIVWVLRYYVDKGKEAEYVKLAKDEGTHSHILAAPGFREQRGYRNWVTDQTQVEYEFESYEAWAKYMDDPKSKALMEKLKSTSHGITSELLGPGLATPQTIRPKK